VGTCCVLLAAAAGAEVIACGSAEWKLGRLKEIGATHVIDTSKEDILKAVHKKFGKPRYSGSGGVDVVVDGKPDQNIRDTRKVSVVMKEGTILDRNKLKLNPATDPGYRPVGGLDSPGRG
jgi:NADPH:quinone reductase-like Zn-dependent oxidoreductase